MTVLTLISGGIALSTIAFLQHSSSPTPSQLSPALTPVTTSIPPGKSSPLPSPAGTTVTLDGELVCLPRQAGGQKALTLECAVGLRTAEGKHYALENINLYLMEGKVTTGQRVQVSGALHSYTEMRYDATGIIYVTSVNKLEN